MLHILTNKFVVVLILLLAFWLRFAGIDQKYGNEIRLVGAAAEYQDLAAYLVTPTVLPPPGNMPGFPLLLSVLHRLLPFEHAEIQVWTSLVFSMANIVLTYLVARRLVTSTMALVTAGFVAVNPALVDNATNGMPEEFYALGLLLLVLVYLRFQEGRDLGIRRCLIMGSLGAMLYSIRSDAVAALLPIVSAVLITQYRKGLTVQFLLRIAPLIALPVSAFVLINRFMNANEIVTASWRAGRGFFYQEFLRGRMPWEYMFYSQISIGKWWFDSHDIARMTEILLLSSTRTLLSIGEYLGGQVLLVVAIWGMYRYYKEHRDVSLPLIAPLCLLPQFLWVYFQPEEDLSRYLTRGLPIVLVFLAVGVEGLCQKASSFLNGARRMVPRTAVLVSVVVAVLSMQAIPFSMYNLSLPYLTPIKYFKYHESAKLIHRRLIGVVSKLAQNSSSDSQVAEEIDSLLKEHPAYVPSYYVAAVVRYHMGDTESAISHLERALEIVPHYAEAGVFLAELYIRSGRTPAASGLIEQMLERRPEFTPLYYIQGQIYLKENQLRSPIDSFKNYIATNRAQHRQAMERELRRNLRIGFSVLAVQSKRRLTLIEEPRFGLMTRGLWRFMTNGLDGLMTGPPVDSEAYRILGLLYLQKKRYDLAKEHLLNAIEVAPGRSGTWNDMGVVHALSGDVDAARKAIDRAFYVNPTRTVDKESEILLINSANLDVLDRRWSTAVKKFQASLMSNPNGSYSRSMIEIISGGQLERAVSVAAQSMKIFPVTVTLPITRFGMGSLNIADMPTRQI